MATNDDSPFFSIDRFMGALKVPARSHLFRCKIIPQNSTVLSYFDDDAPYLCKAVTLPSATVETTELSYFSRAVKIPSRRTYAPITLTFYLSENYKLRKGFDTWTNVLNAYEGNQQSANLYGKIQLTHYSSVDQATADSTALTDRNFKNENTSDAVELAVYTLHDAFPTTINGLQFNYDSDAEIQTFDVEFQYQYFTTKITGRSQHPGAISDFKQYLARLADNLKLETEKKELAYADFLRTLQKTMLEEAEAQMKAGGSKFLILPPTTRSTTDQENNFSQNVKARVASDEAERIKAGGTPFGKTTEERTEAIITNITGNVITSLFNRPTSGKKEKTYAQWIQEINTEIAKQEQARINAGGAPLQPLKPENIANIFAEVAKVFL